MDGFADLDTRRHSVHCARTRLSAHGSLTSAAYKDCRALIDRNNFTALLPGPGSESCHSTLRRLADKIPLAGNSLATLRVCAQRRFTEPELRKAKGERLWVYQAANSGGGMRTVFAKEHKSLSVNDRLKRTPYLAATAVSQLFIAAHGQVKTVGFSTQWQSQHDPSHPFCFGGAINCSDVDAEARCFAEQRARHFAQTLSLRGLNNIDYLWDGHHLYFLELNPRLSSSMQLYEDVTEEGLFAAHWRACQSSSLDKLELADPSAIRAYAPVYAQADCTLAKGFNQWPEGAADRPDTSSTALELKAGQPLCTLTASGSSAAETLGLLQQRIRQLLKAIRR